MCLGLIRFRAPSSALKQKNYHNSPNMLPMITLFEVLFKFMKRHLLTIVSKSCFIFFIGMPHFSRLLFLKKISATYAFHMCVGYDKTKQTPSNKI